MPAGAWISDYYLYVGDRKDFGLLAEKRAATWIYATIRNIRKDPGILYYLGGNQVRFKVFPFSKDEVRKTGFEIIHKEPFTLEIDGQAKQLGDPDHRAVGFENENVLYLTSTEKASLNKTARTPYFHYIVDASNEADVEYQLNKIDNFIASQSDYTQISKVTFANEDHIVTANAAIAKETWQNINPTLDRKSGFFLDRAIKKILFTNYKENTSSYPIILVASDKWQTTIPIVDTRDWAFTIPEGVDYYMLNHAKKLYRHSNEIDSLTPDINPQSLLKQQLVLEYPLGDGSLRYLPDNDEGSLILKQDKFELPDSDISEKDWTSGLLLQAKHHSHTLHPELINNEWTNIVRQSFRSRVMTPLTSYIAVSYTHLTLPTIYSV